MNCINLLQRTKSNGIMSVGDVHVLPAGAQTGCSVHRRTQEASSGRQHLHPGTRWWRGLPSYVCAAASRQDEEKWPGRRSVWAHPPARNRWEIEPIWQIHVIAWRKSMRNSALIECVIVHTRMWGNYQRREEENQITLRNWYLWNKLPCCSHPRSNHWWIKG